MTAQPEAYISEEAYLEAERSSSIKHEYFRGRIYAMTGAKESHNLITANTLASLHGQLRQKPCRVYPSDMRIKVQRTGLNTYPDVVVICGQPQFTDEVRDTIVNPTVIVEVLSSSTERYDRGMKFQNYRAIDTLQDYVLISQDHHHIECYTRQESGLWLLQEVDGIEEKIHIQSIECTLLLEAVYEKVELEQSSNDLPREISPE
jgi:Uma2 family endonuclease